jgi:hypothetical protein
MEIERRSCFGLLVGALLVAGCVTDDFDLDFGTSDFRDHNDTAPGQPGIEAGSGTPDILQSSENMLAPDTGIDLAVVLDGGSCSEKGQSCVGAPKSCCEGLMCCGGIPVPPGEEYCGVTCPISDRNVKFNRSSIDARSVLKRLSTLPISEWTYANESSDVRHVGPMAQDFRAAFGLGADERFIATVDADGIALLAIQALAKEVAELRAELKSLKKSPCKKP